MKAVVLTMASIRRYDNHTEALFVLEEAQETTVLEAIQQQQLPGNGMLIIVEGYATIQKTGRHQQLLDEVVTAQASGNNPNSEELHRQVVYLFQSQTGIIGLRVVWTTDPLKRIVYDVVNGDIQESHV